MRPLFFAALLVVIGLTSSATRGEQRFDFTSYRDVEALFERLGYTPQAWQAGVREVPRLLLTHVPNRWRDKVAKEVSVPTKKRLFFRVMGPIVLRANELILEDRRRLNRLAESATIGTADRDWLTALAERYRIPNTSTDTTDPAVLHELLMRVDVVPPSLALSQAAEESGWGTSRFADLGNAFFGQWTWGEGIRPEAQRTHLGDYRIAAFETPLASLSSYMLNLNTHPAYAAFRNTRAVLRRTGTPVTGRDLVATLTSYSERGEAYVESLRAIMRVNKLHAVDKAYLADGEPIYLVPVGAGSE